MYIVKLKKAPIPFPWKSDYFPRHFAYKKDAIQLKKVIENKGGEAEVVKS